MKKDTEQLQRLSALLAPNNLQEDLAEKLGVSQPMVSQLLAEKVNMGGPLRRLVSLLITELEQQEQTAKRST